MVLTNSTPRKIHLSKFELCVGVTLFCSFAVPSYGACVIFLSTFPFAVNLPKHVLRIDIPFLSSLFVPKRCLSIVLLNA